MWIVQTWPEFIMWKSAHTLLQGYRDKTMPDNELSFNPISSNELQVKQIFDCFYQK